VVEIFRDASHLFEVERRESHAERAGFRISELQISASQKVPWHYHTSITDTFYVLEGGISVHLSDPKETITMRPGESYVVVPKRPHLVANNGSDSATFLVLQGIGEYDYIPLT
jgi:quercetin dioxygenase-like cupin family protein